MHSLKIIAACAILAQAAALDARGVGADLGSGKASYYADKFAGKRTASGENYQPGALTAAHRTARFGSLIRVTHTGNGREVTVRVNDRGPWSGGRIIDLSYAAAKQIGLHQSGTANVHLTLLD
jgi:rare lipoprotein A